MNSYLVGARKRKQTLLIVEGNHEKNQLFWLIFKCFPKIDIDIDDVWIYGTNIYMLYEDIAAEYGSYWASEQDIDIDLPFVISKKKTPNDIRHKDDFTNIIMIFDYERHDPKFSSQKIEDMQKVFFDPTDMGKLYINYPMIESYQHLKSIPDDDFLKRKIPISVKPGKKYKELVRKETCISDLIDFPHKISNMLYEKYCVKEQDIRNRCCDNILGISSTQNIIEILDSILSDTKIPSDKKKTLTYQLKNKISKLGYATNNNSYWKHLEEIFKKIIYHNIYKANYIETNDCEIMSKSYRDCFDSIDLNEILKKQNEVSKNDSGFIWVLNTCIFFIADYNFEFVKM